MNTNRTSMLVVNAVFVVLAACGGGGNDAPATQPPAAAPPPNTAALPITAANAQDITATVFESVVSTGELIAVVDVIGLPAIGNTNGGTSKPSLAAILTEVTACDVGEMTTTWNDADDSLTISTGDAFDVVFDMCFFADSATTLDGAMSLTNMVITGDPFNQIAPWGLAMIFGFDNLVGTDSDGSVTIDGDLDLDLSSDDNIEVSGSIGSTLITVQHSSDSSETLEEYVMVQTDNLNTLTRVIDTSGTYTSTELEGSVTFETLQSFIAVGDFNPSAGQMLIRDSTSSVLVTVLDDMNVQLEIDLDLDGTVDETIVVAWTDLDID